MSKQIQQLKSLNEILEKENELLFKKIYLELQRSCLTMIEKYPEQKKHWEAQMQGLGKNYKQSLDKKGSK